MDGISAAIKVIKQLREGNRAAHAENDKAAIERNGIIETGVRYVLFEMGYTYTYANGEVTVTPRKSEGGAS